MEKWYCSDTEFSDVVLSTRVRLARNLSGLPFPSRLSYEQREELNRLVENTLSNQKSSMISDLSKIRLGQLDRIEALALVEKCIISPEFISEKENKILFLSNDENIAIEVGGRDHFKISVILGGLSLGEAYVLADGMDNVMCDSLSIAFDEQLGYLTESPTDLGTGMHTSVLLHLPGLELMGEISHLVESVSKIGLTLTNAFDEEYCNNSATYQLSNRVTLGISEKSALENLHAITMQIIERERRARSSVDRITIEDNAFRAIGILKSARKISVNEMSTLLSNIKLGIAEGLVKDYDPRLIQSLQILMRDNVLQTNYGAVKDDSIDVIRAEMLRKALC